MRIPPSGHSQSAYIHAARSKAIQRNVANEPVRASSKPNSTTETAAVTQGPSLREQRLQTIREQIAAGTYETAEKWESALDGLFADVFNAPV